MPSAAIGAQIAYDYGGRGNAEPAEQDCVGIVLEDVAAAVENFDVALQRFEVARIDHTGGVVDGMAVASLARRPFEGNIWQWIKSGHRIDGVVVGEVRDWRGRGESLRQQPQRSH